MRNSIARDVVVLLLIRPSSDPELGKKQKTNKKQNKKQHIL
jgi:hypothetical protein